MDTPVEPRQALRDFFNAERKEVVDRIAGWEQKTDSGNIDIVIIETDKVSHILRSWIPLAGENTGICFSTKITYIVSVLGHLKVNLLWWYERMPEREGISDLYDMVGGQIGRLTLEGYDDSDSYAVNMAQSIERSDWLFKNWYPVGPTPELNYDSEDPSGRIKQLWKHLHVVSFDGCQCRQCLGYYRPHESDMID